MSLFPKKTYMRLRTRDRHEALIERQRSIGSCFRYMYYVTIFSKHSRNVMVAGWKTGKKDLVENEVRNWTVGKILEDSPYLKDVLAAYFT